MNNGNGNGNGHDPDRITTIPAPPPSSEAEELEILTNPHAPPLEELQADYDPRDPEVPMARVVRDMAYRMMWFNEQFRELKANFEKFAESQTREMASLTERVKDLEAEELDA